MGQTTPQNSLIVIVRDKIAFAPLAFQAIKSMINLGILQAIEDADEQGTSRKELAEKTGISEYGVGVLCEMALGMFKSPVKLTMNQELELLDIIKTDHEKRSKYNRMLSWFTNFCKEYGYESKFKRDRGGEANEMAWGFCMCHGLDIDVLKRAPKPQEPHQDTPAKSVWTLLLIGFLGGLYVLAAISFILWSHQMEGFGLSIIPMLIGWSMICVPIYLFFRNKKQ